MYMIPWWKRRYRSTGYQLKYQLRNRKCRISEHRHLIYIRVHTSGYESADLRISRYRLRDISVQTSGYKSADSRISGSRLQDSRNRLQDIRMKTSRYQGIRAKTS
jgi:hypothetical protein